MLHVLIAIALLVGAAWGHGTTAPASPAEAAEQLELSFEEIELVAVPPVAVAHRLVPLPLAARVPTPLRSHTERARVFRPPRS